MKDHLKQYKGKLEKGICEYMQMPVSERSATAIHAMFKALRDVDRRMVTSQEFSYEDACKWMQHLQNADGSTGAHWDMDATGAVAAAAGVEFEHLYAYDWWAAMNMIWSDYSPVAKKFGVDTAEFYAEMAKAFLFDQDGPGPVEKLAAYYHGIVCPEKY